MTAQKLPSPELLRKLLRYEPETGKLFWRERPLEMFKCVRDQRKWNNRFSGLEGITSISRKGYKTGTIVGVTLRAHRLIWAMQTDAWPEDEIDHIDRDRSNNRWVNLRAATRTQNGGNLASKPNSSSSYLGVSSFFGSPTKKWRAQVMHKGKRYYLGSFVTEVEAAQAYDKFAKDLRGEFTGLNFPDQQKDSTA